MGGLVDDSPGLKRVSVCRRVYIVWWVGGVGRVNYGC